MCKCGNNCQGPNSCNLCYQDCPDIYKSSCIIYTGAANPRLNLVYGDNLNFVLSQMINAILTGSTIFYTESDVNIGTGATVDATIGSPLNVGTNIKGSDFIIQVGPPTGTGINGEFNLDFAQESSVSGTIQATTITGERILGNQTSTTNATPTIIKTVATVSNTAYNITVDVVGIRTGGSSGSAGDSSAFKINSLAKNIAGTLTVVGQNITSGFSDNGNCTATISVSGTNLVFTVTGDTNNNYDWKAIISIVQIA